MDIFATDWRHGDEKNSESEQFKIQLFGKTLDGRTVLARIKFTPVFLLEMPENWSDSRQKLFITETALKYGAVKELCLPTKRKSLWGFDNERMRTLAQFAFPTMDKFKKAKYALKRTYQLYETTIDPVVRLLHLRGLSSAGWVRIDRFVEATKRISRSDVEIECTFATLAPSAIVATPPLVIASWDIETYSRERKFPLASNHDDHCIQIATSFQRYGEDEPFRRVVVCLDETAGVDGVEIVSCARESDMINAWMDLVGKEKTDVLVSYNGHQYDWKYISGRAQMLIDDTTGEDTVFLSKLGRLIDSGGEIIERELTSNAFGQNFFHYLDVPGTMQFDLLQWVRKNRNLESYSLNNVSKLYLGDQKDDLPAMQIFERFEGDAADRAVIAKYAAQDTLLPLKLLRKLAIFEDITEMANAVKVPVDMILYRGQQVRAFSCLFGKARVMGYAIPDDKAWTIDGKFEGATVLDPKKGAYYEPIAALDFASLYPSIMRAHNMSPETLVMDSRYDNLPGVEYYTIKTGIGTFRYSQKSQGVVPALLDDLAKFRKHAKKLMAAAHKDGDEFKESLYDASQRSYKVVMNSVYGFLGAQKGFVPCVPIAASVTATGRVMIELAARRAVELLPGSDVVYGDSVASYTPVLIKRDGLIDVVKIENLTTEWKLMDDGKESAELRDVFSWTDSGWTKIERVIRHKIDKPMVRVITHTAIVDVTDEHSLLDVDANAITPKDSAVGTRLLHTKMPEIERIVDQFSADEARILGFFAGDGSCGVYECPSGRKATYALNGASMSCLKFYKNLCERVYPLFGWVIMDTMRSSSVRKLVPRTNVYGAITRFVVSMRALMYSDTKNKIVPSGILNGTREVRQAFWDGFYDADGTKSDEKNVEISQKSQLTCAGLTFLAYSLGYEHVVLDGRRDKPEVFRLRMRSAAQKLRKKTDAIKTMHEIPSTEYVYDLTTENHHFQAGVGTMIVHNTDSIMVKMKLPEGYDQSNIDDHFKVAAWLAGEITKEYKHPNDLEFEKIYFPYILYSKKRYAAVKFEEPGKGKLDVKGIALVRRDFSPITREILSESLNTILFAKDTPTAVTDTREKLRKVLDNEYPLEKFVMSKTLRTGYKNLMQPHLIVADKIFDRTGFPVASGARVPFVYVEDKANIDQKQSMRAEDPTYAKEHGLVVDRLFYIEHQLQKPLLSLFEPLLFEKTNAQLFGHPDLAGKIIELDLRRKGELKETKRVKKNVANRQHEITTFFKPKK